MYISQIILNSFEFVLNSTKNEIPELCFRAIQLLLDPAFDEGFNFEDLISESSDFSGRPFVEIHLYQKEKFYTEGEIVSIKRFFDNPEYILIDDIPIRFSKFHKSLQDFGYLVSSGLGVLHFLDSEKINKILSWNLRDPWKTVREVFQSEDIIRLVKQRSGVVENKMLSKAVSNDFGELNLEVSNAKSVLGNSSDYFKLRKKFNALLKVFVEQDMKLMLEEFNRAKSRIQKLENKITEIEHQKLDAPVCNLQINREFLDNLSNNLKSRENHIPFSLNCSSDKDVHSTLVAKKESESSVTEEFNSLEKLWDNLKKLSDEKIELKANLDYHDLIASLMSSKIRDEEEFDRVLNDIQIQIKNSATDIQKFQNALRTYSAIRREATTSLIRENERIEEFRNLQVEFPEKIQNFCAKVQDFTRRLIDVKEELMKLDRKILTHEIKISELVQTCQLDEKFIQGIQKVCEFLLLSDDDTLVENFYGPIFKFLRSDVDVESKLWMGISSLACVILFKNKNVMEKVAVELEGCDIQFIFMSLDSIYTDPPPLIPSDLKQKITFATSLIKSDTVIKKALELIFQHVLSTEDQEHLAKFKLTRYDVSSNNGAINLHNNVLSGGHTSNLLEKINLSRIKTLKLIYKIIRQVGDLKIVKAEKLKSIDRFERCIEEENRKITSNYDMLVEKFPVFCSSDECYETLLESLEITTEIQSHVESINRTQHYLKKVSDEARNITNFDFTVHNNAISNLREKLNLKENEVDDLFVKIQANQDKIKSKISELQEINSDSYLEEEYNVIFVPEALKSLNQLEEFNDKQKELYQEFNGHVESFLKNEKRNWVERVQKNQQSLEKQNQLEEKLKKIETKISQKNIKLQVLKNQLATYQKFLDDLNVNGVRSVDEELYNQQKNSNIENIHDAIQTISQEIDDCEPHLDVPNYVKLRKCIDSVKKEEQKISNPHNHNQILDSIAYMQKYMVKILKDLIANYEISFKLIMKDHVESSYVVFSTAESGDEYICSIDEFDSFDLNAIKYMIMRVKFNEATDGQLLSSAVDYVDWILLILHLIRNLSHFNFVIISQSSIENLGPSISSRFRKYLDILSNYVQIIFIQDN